MANMRQAPLICSGHTRPVVDLAFSDITPFGYFLISACKDGKPMLRQGDTGDWIGTFEGHKGAVWGATLNKDATRAATGAADFSAKVWNAETGEEVHSFPHKHIVKSVDFSKCSTRLLTGSNEKVLYLFDLNQPDAEAEVFAGHTANIKAAVFSPDGKKIISASEDRTIRMWDASLCQEVRCLELDTAPSSLTLSRNGDIVIVTSGKDVSFYRIDTLVKMKTVTFDTVINSASLHESGDVFVAGGHDFKMYKYDYGSGKEIESSRGHFGPVHCVRFSPDGELYASGSEDGTLRLWQTTVGKTYGLWRCAAPAEHDDDAEPDKQNSLPTNTGHCAEA